MDSTDVEPPDEIDASKETIQSVVEINIENIHSAAGTETDKTDIENKNGMDNSLDLPKKNAGNSQSEENISRNRENDTDFLGLKDNNSKTFNMTEHDNDVCEDYRNDSASVERGRLQGDSFKTLDSASSDLNEQSSFSQKDNEFDCEYSNNICYIFDKNDLNESEEKLDNISDARSTDTDFPKVMDRADHNEIQDTIGEGNHGDLPEKILSPANKPYDTDRADNARHIVDKDEMSSENLPYDSNNCSEDNNSNVRSFRAITSSSTNVSKCSISDTTVSNHDDDVNNNKKNTGTIKQYLNLNLPCQSPETDGRGVSPEIICFTHLSPTALYGKDQLPSSRFLSNQEYSSRPPSLNTPDPVFGDSDSSCCPTPFLYTSSDCMHTYGDNLYTSNENVHRSAGQFKANDYPCAFSEDPLAYSSNSDRGLKRKVNEIDVDKAETDHNNNETTKVSPVMLSYSNKSPDFTAQLYQYQGRPPDVSTWTAVNSGGCKYGVGFSNNSGQNYVNNLTRDPFLFSYQQQFSDCGYNAQINGQFSAKPTCTVPPYLLNHTQTSGSIYSAYNNSYGNSNYGNQQDGSSQFDIPACRSNFTNTAFDPSERTRASCQFAPSPSIDLNNNIQFNTSSACCRLDFSSPVSQEQYSNTFPIPTFVSTHSYLSSLSRPEPVFPNNLPQSSSRAATCTSIYCRPSSSMSTHSDIGTETPSIDLTHVTSDEEAVADEDTVTETMAEPEDDKIVTKTNEGEVLTQRNKDDSVSEVNKPDNLPETSRVTWSSTNLIVPVKARNTQLMCPLTDLRSRTVKELIQSAENKSESDGETNASSSTLSCSTPPPAHQKVSESFAAEFIEQRKTKSPISAFCAALDLSKPKKKDKYILPQPQSYRVEPAIPITSLLNINGPTLAFSGSMMVPYLQTVCAANANLGNAGTVPHLSVASNKCVPILSSKTPNTYSETANQYTVAPAVPIAPQAAMMNFTPYSANFAALPSSGFQYLPYMGTAAAAVPLNHITTSGDLAPSINISNIPLPLYSQLPQTVGQLQQCSQTPEQSQSVEQLSIQENQQNKEYLCRRSIGLAVPETKDPAKPARKRETRQRKKKSAVLSIAPPAATVAAYTASIQGSSVITTGPEPSKDAVTYYPTPSRIGEIVRQDCGKRVFKARHCNFSVLRIGTFQYTCPTISYEKVARVKFLYSKKKLLYEFQLNDLEAATITPHRRLTEIEVPFNTVVGLWMYDRELRLEVNTPPTMFLGSKILEKHTKYGVHAPPVYDRNQLVDLTDGQLKTVPYHYIQFKSCCGEKLKTEMGQFDSRFSMLLKSPLIEDPNKSLRQPEVPISSHLLDPILPVGKPKGRGGRHKSVTGCRCETGCSSDLCMCCVRGGTCTEGECLCINCRNPLNILHQLGLPVYRARTDACLMENIYQIKKLECYVKIQLVLECCQIPLTLLQCIPGTFTCPSIGCGIKYAYSWCSAQLCNEDIAPRNHCVRCGRCTDYRNRHCELCNICYFAGESGSFKCPVCHNGLEDEPFGLDSSSDSDG